MRVSVQLPAVESSTRAAREFVRGELGDIVPAITLYDLVTVVSELASNAIRFGEGDEIRVWVDVAPDGKVTGEVENEGEGEVHRRPIRPEEQTGLGLHIVDEVAESWHAMNGAGTRVHFELRAP